MPTHIALLRGINLGGHNKILMADLRELHAELGHTDIRTYIQSGNVVFHADTTDTSTLAAEIGAAITARFGFDVAVVIRSADDLAAAIAANPYAADADPAHLAIAFLSARPEPGRVDTIDPTTHQPDVFTVIGREVHLHCPSGFARTKLTNNLLARALGVDATTRNWRTVNKLRVLGAS